MDEHTEEPLRIVEVWRNEQWERGRLKDIVVGEAFKVYDDDADPKRDVVYYARKEPYIAENGRWTITAQPAVKVVA